MNDKVYVFSKEEFMLLAAASGIRQMYGFSLNIDADEQSAIFAMQELVKKGCLLSVNGKFEVQEPIAELFLQMKDAKTTIDVHKRSGKKCIIYIDECGIKVSVSERRERILQIQKLMLGEIWEHLKEEGWIPENKEELH